MDGCSLAGISRRISWKVNGTIERVWKKKAEEQAGERREMFALQQPLTNQTDVFCRRVCYQCCVGDNTKMGEIQEILLDRQNEFTV